MGSECTTNAVTLKDYIIDVENVSAKAAAQYEVVLENNTDFIIKRRTMKTDRELVILVSKGLFYIKDCKTGQIDSLTEGNLNTFLRDLRDRYITLQQVHWINVIFRESVELIMTVTTNESLLDMCRHNVLVNSPYPHWFVSFWKQNSKLFTRLYNLFPNMADPKKYQPSIPVIFWIEECFGTNEAMYFAEKLVQSGVSDLNFSDSYYNRHQNAPNIEAFKSVIESPHNINLRRFIDYILFDLYAQGYAAIDRHFFTEYKDYLRMQMDFYGKVKEKYPAHFKTEHDVMALKVNQAKLIAACENFAEQSEQIKDLAYTGGRYSIVIPTKPEELAEEGINLNHCVGQYIDRVASGECHILFLRLRSAADQSLVTLQLSGKQICQAQGKNRRAVTKQEHRFLQQWGREKEIEIAV